MAKKHDKREERAAAKERRAFRAVEMHLVRAIAKSSSAKDRHDLKEARRLCAEAGKTLLGTKDAGSLTSGFFDPAMHLTRRECLLRQKVRRERLRKRLASVEIPEQAYAVAPPSPDDILAFAIAAKCFDDGNPAMAVARLAKRFQQKLHPEIWAAYQKELSLPGKLGERMRRADTLVRSSRRGKRFSLTELFIAYNFFDLNAPRVYVKESGMPLRVFEFETPLCEQSPAEAYRQLRKAGCDEIRCITDYLKHLKRLRLL